MESKISCRDPELEESFSFSSFDVISCPGFFFSDNDDDEEDEEAYIEIALQHTPTSPHGEENYKTDNELDFRLSFSPLVHFPLLSSSSTTSFSSTPTSLGSSDIAHHDAISSLGLPAPSKISHAHATNNGKVQFPVVGRVLNMLLTALKGSSSKIGDESCRSHQNRQLPDTPVNGDLLQGSIIKTSKPSKVATAASNGSVMKFLVKFRSINFHSMLASVVKGRQLNSPGGSSQQKKRRSEAKPVQRNRGESTTNNKKSMGNEEKSRVLEINLDAIRGVLEAVTMNINRRKGKQTKSCPSSIKSSPTHGGVPTDQSKIYATENSVQAAIDHCKTSFGQTVDFHFRTPSNMN
ncbi:hypothetical protein F0562_015081 [Nyssa sinensis]|uniref:Uncharacterized protein n=1 Tax=Nyssa sinensis TaxID=561372 RepID=A0A5J4ZK10_9ASTE|nr:hypothetical protein F0562_015081 [Nyssa sinensis]